MYDVLKDLNKSVQINVIDLTTKFEGDYDYIPAFYDDNVKTFPFEGTKFLEYEEYHLSGDTLPLSDEDLEKMKPYYNNVTLVNDKWPTELQILQDYFNHCGCPPEYKIEEGMLLVGNVLGQESLGWFDGCLCFIVRFCDNIFVYKLCKHDKIKMDEINCKRPFNSCIYIKPEEIKDPESTLRVSITLSYHWKPEYIDVNLENVRIKDIYNPYFVDFAFRFKDKGYSDIEN